MSTLKNLPIPHSPLKFSYLCIPALSYISWDKNPILLVVVCYLTERGCIV